MRNIHLHGVLAEKYGPLFQLEVETAAEAIRALGVNFPGFLKDIADGAWHVVRGKSPDNGISLGEEEIAGFRLGKGDLHILPAVIGSKRSGVLKLVMGVAMVGLAFSGAGFLAAPISGTLFGATTWGNAIGMLGLSMALAGAATLLAPEQNNETEDDSSDLMGGTQGSAPEGTGVPIVYGEVITGGVIISAGIDVEGSNQASSAVPDPTAMQAIKDFYNDKFSNGAA